MRYKNEVVRLPSARSFEIYFRYRWLQARLVTSNRSAPQKSKNMRVHGYLNLHRIHIYVLYSTSPLECATTAQSGGVGAKNVSYLSAFTFCLLDLIHVCTQEVCTAGRIEKKGSNTCSPVHSTVVVITISSFGTARSLRQISNLALFS